MKVHARAMFVRKCSLPSCIMARLLKISGIFFIMYFSITTSKAEVLLWKTYDQNEPITGGTFADFNGSASGGTSFTFTTTAANQRVIIYFDTTCFFNGGAEDDFVLINILVDPAGPVGEFAAPPTNAPANGGVILCTAHGAGANNTDRGSVMASAVPGQAGTNKVRVKLTTASAGSTPTVFLDTMSLAVVR